MSEFVDTNVFLRLLTGDDPRKAARCLALFQRAQQGDVELVTSESVVAEVVFVLASPANYRMLRPTIASALRPLLRNPGLRIDHKGSVIQALDRWEQSRLDFEDCLSVEYVRRLQLAAIYSYDRDFDRVPGLTRLEP
jgi:predicted nucleic acid-binding protein